MESIGRRDGRNRQQSGSDEQPPGASRDLPDPSVPDLDLTNAAAQLPVYADV
ncbi:hypothetical protein [Mycobacteroides franklinii]|uniref:hypothetical protein n=1 Tax=Mycobacteroides franklinii TaxID=948102 RepID=UPI001E4DB5EC|nr:hypothetical protein [Mycobacteroides franklinii]